MNQDLSGNSELFTDINKSGDPNPNSIMHIIEKIKKYNRFNKKLIPTSCSIIN